MSAGAPAATILDAAEGADLVVIGRRGVGGFQRLLLGSVSEHVARHAPCPVVVLPAAEDPAAEDAEDDEAPPAADGTSDDPADREVAG